jgi:outer membrane protein OmpA-like peptidoglycan-associated protein
MATQLGDTAVKATKSPSAPFYGLLVGCAVAAVLSGCATKPPDDPALIQAREAVDRLESDPLAQQIAGKPLTDAKDWLAQAEDANRDKKPQDQVDYLAYLAKRKADLGEAVVDENRARQRIAQSQQQRDAVLLASRERETQTARDQAAGSQAQAEIAQQQAAASAAQAAAAQKELADMQAKQTERGMVLTIGSNLLFDTNSDVLKPGADDSLDRVAAFLKEHQDVDVRVEGHTDSTGSASYNDALSERRAGSVAHALVSRGLDAGRVRSVGRGQNFPVAGNDTASGRQQNRRVEIIFSDMKGQFVSTR